MPDDAAALDVGADHEARYVRQEQQRDLERVAQPDEARGLVGRIAEEDAPLLHRLVGEDADRVSVQSGEPREQLFREQLLDLEPSALVDKRLYHLAHVVAAIRLFRNQIADRLRGGARRFRFDSCRLFARSLRHVPEVRAGILDRLLLAGDQSVTTSALGAVHARAAQLLERY